MLDNSTSNKLVSNGNNEMTKYILVCVREQSFIYLLWEVQTYVSSGMTIYIYIVNKVLLK